MQESGTLGSLGYLTDPLPQTVEAADLSHLSRWGNAIDTHWVSSGFWALFPVGTHFLALPTKTPPLLL
jgi:hypothetical protein